MANGQQIAEKNYANFVSWASSKTDSDFKEYVLKGKLNRTEISAECGFGKSALTQNPAIKSALTELEVGLRHRGVLPPLKEVKSGDPVHPARDRNASGRRKDAQRLNALEQENAALRAELRNAKLMLERYKLLSEFIHETGRLPR
ncbi:MAG: VPA1267 family protein [Pseudohongiella nitratireducens]|nr:VPA1267 family protein [Pseudohongiella nitratireducens]MDF1624051.1 VPA1267 family protein [Pseudohongiella nitratireducens]